MVNYTIAPPSVLPGSGVRGYLFVVSHMRSLSSVLCHVLGSNAEVAGYAELHLAYAGRNSLRELERRVAAATDASVAGKYVLDKIVHDQYEIANGVLARPDVRVLYLLRQPARAFESMLDLSDVLGGKPGEARPELVFRYYCARLESLARYSLHTQGRSAFVDTERLIADPESVLDRLADWLALREPMPRDYRTFKYTGIYGYGDPSAAIRTGRLEPELANRNTSGTIAPIPADTLARATAAWAACRDVLIRRCRVL
jgi:hypothetical protein